MFLPFCLTEADQDGVAVNDKRSFYQHSVRCKQVNFLLVGHGRKLLFKIQRLVEHAACVKQLFNLNTACLDPRLKLIGGWIFLFNMSVNIINVMLAEPLLRLLAG